MQGLGYGLTEVVLMKEGRVLNANFRDYKVPTVKDIPELEVCFVGNPDPVGPFGAKGVGEPAIVPTIAALGNAIYDAAGVRLTKVPFLPEDILEALRNGRRNGTNTRSSGEE